MSYLYYFLQLKELKHTRDWVRKRTATSIVILKTRQYTFICTNKR